MYSIKSGFELELLRLIRHGHDFIFAIQIELHFSVKMLPFGKDLFKHISAGLP